MGKICSILYKKEKGFALFSLILNRDITGTHERLTLACKNGEI